MLALDAMVTMLPARALNAVVGPLCRRCDLRVLLLVVVVCAIGAVIGAAVVFDPDAVGGSDEQGAAERVWP
jgi:hypothetical protein